MNFAVLIISPPDYTHSQAFQEVAQTIHYSLLALGHHSVITTQITPGYQHIVLGANLLPFFPVSLPTNSIVYNLEQISSDSPWLDAEMLELFQRFPLWDYSQKNILNFAHFGISQIQHVPIGYVPQLTRIEPLAAVDRDIDVLFYGSINERRQEIIESLEKAGIKVSSVFDVYGEARDQLIQRSKIVLNLHYYSAQVFEIVRVSYLLANKQFVISEICEDDPEVDDFAAGVVFAQYENLVQTCLEFLDKPTARSEIAETGFNLMRQRDEATYLKAAIQDLPEVSAGFPVPGLRVDLGCGSRKKYGFIGVDIYPAPAVDIIADLRQRFPFADNTVGELRAYDFIEHLPDRIHTMNEIWRVCKPGARVDIFVPSTDGRGAFQDPTHVSYWNINSFQYYSVAHPGYLALCRSYGFCGAFKIISLEHYEFPNQIIHVHAVLSVVKE